MRGKLSTLFKSGDFWENLIIIESMGVMEYSNDKLKSRI